MIDKEYLKAKAETMGFLINNQQLEKFSQYAQTLVEWNEKINLTAIIKPEEIVTKHFIDSLLLLNHIPSDKFSMIDVGTGAGFPSIPCKIMNNDINLTMLDSLNKRVIFLNELIATINVKATCIHARAEEAANFTSKLNLRDNFDIATARAVANLRDLCEYCLPFVKVNGAFIALKGYDCEDELVEANIAIKTLGGEVSEVKKYILPDESKRAIIVIRKISQTPTKYPRNMGKMKKQPL